MLKVSKMRLSGLSVAVLALTVRVSAQAKVKAGDSVGLAVAANHVNWFDAASGVRV